MINTFKELKHKFRENPGDPIFAEYAECLRQVKRYSVAISVCLKGLTLNPTCDRGRLVLSRIYYDCGYRQFAINELSFLYQKYPENLYIERLLSQIKNSKNQLQQNTSIVYSSRESHFQNLSL